VLHTVGRGNTDGLDNANGCVDSLLGDEGGAIANGLDAAHSGSDSSIDGTAEDPV
jgi:hypothetical protein